MKLSEIDKSKLPIKVVSDIIGDVFTVIFMNDEHALLTDNLGTPGGYHVDRDMWSPYQEPKTKVALYAYKLKSQTYWMQSHVYFTDDEDAIASSLS